MKTWTKATKKVMSQIKPFCKYVVIYDGGKTGIFDYNVLKAAYESESVILDWIIEMPI